MQKSIVHFSLFLALIVLSSCHSEDHNFQNELPLKLTKWELVYENANNVLKDSVRSGLVFSKKQEKKYRIRSVIKFPGSGNELSLFVFKSFSAYNVYINDSLLYKNGLIHEESEEPGQLVKTIRIPQIFLTGIEEKIEIEFSGHSFKKGPFTHSILLGTSQQINNYRSAYSKRALLIDGFLALSVLLNLALFISYRRKLSYLFLAFVFLSHFIKLYIYNETMMIPMNSLDYYIGLDKTRYIFSVLGKVFIGIFFVAEFKLPQKKYLYLLVCVASLLRYLIEFNLNYLFALFAFFPLYAIYKNEKNAWFALIGFLVFVSFTFLENEYEIQLGYMIGILFFSLSMLFTLAMQVYKDNKEKQIAVLKSSRLETQLLQKHIQPHFLMNSLQSLKALITINPEKASELIDALSDEFHLLAEIGQKKLIPLENELEICKIHLKIMGFRKKSEFKLKVEGVTEKLMVPPSLFHTLVENGISHGYKGVRDGTFLLKIKKDENCLSYCFFNDSEKNDDPVFLKYGTGYKYIEARLEESFPGKWKFNSGPVENGWESIITIKDYHV